MSKQTILTSLYRPLWQADPELKNMFTKIFEMFGDALNKTTKGGSDLILACIDKPPLIEIGFDCDARLVDMGGEVAHATVVCRADEESANEIEGMASAVAKALRLAKMFRILIQTKGLGVPVADKDRKWMDSLLKGDAGDMRFSPKEPEEPKGPEGKKPLDKTGGI